MTLTSRSDCMQVHDHVDECHRVVELPHRVVASFVLSKKIKGFSLIFDTAGHTGALLASQGYLFQSNQRTNMLGNKYSSAKTLQKHYSIYRLTENVIYILTGWFFS